MLSAHYRRFRARLPHTIPTFGLVAVWLWALAALCWAGGEPALDNHPQPVVWRSLEFEGHKALSQVNTRVNLRRLTTTETREQLISDEPDHPVMPGSSQVLRLATSIEAALPFQRKRWQGQVWFLEGDGSALQRVRYKPGLDGSEKRFRFGRGGVYRWRAEPRNAAEAQLSPDQWGKRRGRLYPYTGDTGQCQRVSDPLVLLYLASAVPMAPGQGFDICVFNKKALHRVRVEAMGSEPLAVAYQQRGGGEVERELSALKLRLLATPLDPNGRSFDPFEFMGLEGTVEILIDPKTRLPLLLRGQLPGVGRSEFRLVEADVRT